MARKVRIIEAVRQEDEALKQAAALEGVRLRLYTPCPGNVMPTGPRHPPSAHPPIVFLARKVCRDPHKSIHMQCLLCGHRMFLTGDFWRAAFWTLEQVLAVCPEAVDGRGFSLAARR